MVSVAWGSRSAVTTRSPSWAAAAARLRASMVLPQPPLGEASKSRLGAARALVVFRKGAFTLNSMNVGIRVTRYLRRSKTKWLTSELLVLLSIRFPSVHPEDGALFPQITDRSVILAELLVRLCPAKRRLYGGPDR